MKTEKYHIDIGSHIDTLNIGYKCHDYLGHKMGYKVFINGSKYPRKRGYYYTSMHLQNCIRLALNDYYNIK